MKTYTLKRTGNRPLRFEGELVAEADADFDAGMARAEEDLETKLKALCKDYPELEKEVNAYLDNDEIVSRIAHKLKDVIGALQAENEALKKGRGE
jgi:hypothetical protein